jgi:hypothetical protein
MEEISKGVVDAIYAEIGGRLLQERPRLAIQQRGDVHAVRSKDARDLRPCDPPLHLLFVVILIGIGDHVIDDVRECGMAHVVQKTGDLLLEGTADPADAEHRPHGVVVSTEVATFSD